MVGLFYSFVRSVLFIHLGFPVTVGLFYSIIRSLLFIHSGFIRSLLFIH
jgi:hypothetical protein